VHPSQFDDLPRCTFHGKDAAQVIKDTSMSVDIDTVRKVARLARIHEPEERLEALTGELNGILGWIEQLNEVDVDGVEPMTSAVAMTLPLRADEVVDGGIPALVTANAPRSEDGFFVVPKVVE
jgi:aspartyl-tRNA(Asn)/glutamyl-tRNA(Gln) amidotransferase subunit C